MTLNNGDEIRNLAGLQCERRQKRVRREEGAEDDCETSSGVSNGELLLQRRGARRPLTF